jgi:hypothetical protein
MECGTYKLLTYFRVAKMGSLITLAVSITVHLAFCITDRTVMLNTARASRCEMQA